VTALTFCPADDGLTDLETRLIQCSLYDTTYRTIYVHSETLYGHSHTMPIYDSHAFPALRASDVILDGTIDVVFGLVEYNGETFATVHDHFVYMYVGDRDDSTWYGVDFNMWNAVLHDGTVSANGCLTGVPPQAPPAPAAPPTHPPVYYVDTNATACPNGPLTIEQCDAAYEVNIGALPVSGIHVVGNDHITHPTGCIIDGGLYEYNSFSTSVPCSTTYPCLCHDPDNHTHPSPIQPPAPPVAPPPPSPPFRPPSPQQPPPSSPSSPSSPLPPSAPPPFNTTVVVGGLSVNASDPDWNFEVIIMQGTKHRVYFEPGYAFEENDFVIFVPMTFTEANPGSECTIANSLSWTSLDEDPTDMSSSDHGGPILKDSNGNLYVDIVLYNQAPASDDPLADPDPELTQSANYRTCLAKHPDNYGRRELTTISYPFPIAPDQWIFVDQDQIHVRSKVRTQPPFTHTQHHTQTESAVGIRPFAHKPQPSEQDS